MKKYFLGCDVSKGYADFVILDSNKKIVGNYFQLYDTFNSIRKQWVFVKLPVKQRVQLLYQLESIVYTANTEVLSYCKDSTPNWVLQVLKQYPTAKRLSRAKVSSLIKIPYVSREKAEALITKAKLSISSSDDKTTETIIKATVEQILQLAKVIAFHGKQMQASCNLPEVKILESFTGIGIYSAVGLLLEIGAIERFASAKKPAAFFGLHPTLKSSGDGRVG